VRTAGELQVDHHASGQAARRYDNETFMRRCMVMDVRFKFVYISWSLTVYVLKTVTIVMKDIYTAIAKQKA
jgi:hypothetical protein